VALANVEATIEELVEMKRWSLFFFSTEVAVFCVKRQGVLSSGIYPLMIWANTRIEKERSDCRAGQWQHVRMRLV
jgi:hypothetical protein